MNQNTASRRITPAAIGHLPGPLRLPARLLVWTVIAGLLALPAYANQLAQKAAANTAGAKQRPVPLTREDEPETVVIDGFYYIVPPPWAGNKIEAPTLSADSFRQIPIEHTHNQAKIYVHSLTLQPLLALLDRARGDGVELLVESGYRSERYQRMIFKRMMAKGRRFADIIRYVAPPGYSQHALGTAVDFHPSDWRFADTRAYAWLKANAAAFSFKETYSRTNDLNMPWEAWHWNYCGE